MISYFNSGYLIRYPVAFLIACLVWIPSFVSPDIYFEPNSVFSLLNVDIEWFRGQYLIFIWVSFLLTLISALAINQILREYDLVNMHNTASLVVFVLLTSTLPLFTSVNSFIIINLLLILFIQGILKLSVVETPVSTLFNASFFLGMASLLYIPLVYFLPFIWIAILINRHTDLRNFLVSLAAMLLPYLLIFAFFYWNDTAIEHWQKLLLMLTDMNFSFLFNLLTYFEIGLLLFLALVIIISFLILSGRMVEKSNYTRKNIVVIFYYLLATGVIFLLFSDHPAQLLLISLPATFVVTIAVYTVNKNRFINILFSLLLICIILNHYYQLLNATELIFK
ncbi:MAG: hypothetical protein KQH67_04535 [Bacteroidetes bacterium]|nr:hypothetical protein [Bacteroidota bacterium]